MTPELNPRIGTSVGMLGLDRVDSEQSTLHRASLS
jgi:hypothetical protein